MDWKKEIIEMTQLKAARESKIDATFFPPVSEEELVKWLQLNEVDLPEDWRSYFLQSNGLEAQRGELWPLLPLEEWELLPKGCSLEHPWIELGRSMTHRYFLNLGSLAVWRVEILGSNPEFFAASLMQYLKAVFQGKS